MNRTSLLSSLFLFNEIFPMLRQNLFAFSPVAPIFQFGKSFHLFKPS